MCTVKSDNANTYWRHGGGSVGVGTEGAVVEVLDSGPVGRGVGGVGGGELGRHGDLAGLVEEPVAPEKLFRYI